MARMNRLCVAGLPHHVLQIGHNSQPVVLDESDHDRLMQIAREAAGTNMVQLHAYVVADSVIHWILTPQADDGVSKFIQSLGRRYGRHFNARYQRSGSLWDGRFRCTVFEPEKWMVPHLLWVDGLPVRQGLVMQAEEYRWSSARHHVGEGLLMGLHLPHQYWAIGNTPFDRESRYRRLLREGQSQDEVQRIQDAVYGGWALGREQFLEEISKATGRRVTRGKRGRPRKQGAPSVDAGLQPG